MKKNLPMAQETSTTSLGPFFAFLVIWRCIRRLRFLFCPVLIVPLIVRRCHRFGLSLCVSISVPVVILWWLSLSNSLSLVFVP